MVADPSREPTAVSRRPISYVRALVCRHRPDPRLRLGVSGHAEELRRRRRPADRRGAAPAVDVRAGGRPVPGGAGRRAAGREAAQRHRPERLDRGGAPRASGTAQLRRAPTPTAAARLTGVWRCPARWCRRWRRRSARCRRWSAPDGRTTRRRPGRAADRGARHVGRRRGVAPGRPGARPSRLVGRGRRRRRRLRSGDDVRGDRRRRDRSGQLGERRQRRGRSRGHTGACRHRRRIRSQGERAGAPPGRPGSRTGAAGRGAPVAGGGGGGR